MKMRVEKREDLAALETRYCVNEDNEWEMSPGGSEPLKDFESSSKAKTCFVRGIQ